MSVYPFAHFMISAAAAAQFPHDAGAEVAIVGRSNAGKSSAINAITARRSLARTSKTPGRTRLLNFFELSPGARLIDLPGYGYAAGARSERAGWAALVQGLAPRRSLRGLLLVVDARRGILPGDLQLLGWAHSLGRPVHVLLSKSDQLKRAEAPRLLAESQATLERLAGRGTAQLFSAHTGAGLAEARARLDAWLLEGSSNAEVQKESPGSTRQ
ncbi:MAG TPA: ribosome biogenesis GTP-binding protein YihA/YsxC [Steroidobacteraceae bacterium]